MRIAYRRHGRGPAVLLIHGVGGDAGNWDPIADRLARRLDVMAMDLRGHGQSAVIDGAVDVHDFARDAAQVLDEGRHGLLVGGEDRTELARAILVQLSGYAVRPGDRARAYGLPGAAYLDLVEAVMAEMDGTARAAA
jgi:hypothetical protein